MMKDRCVPEELPALIEVLPSIYVLRCETLCGPHLHASAFLFWTLYGSPNAEEALSLLSIPLPATKPSIEEACARFLDLGVGPDGSGWVIIRSGSMGAYVASRGHQGQWIEAYWTDATQVVDVTGGSL